MADEPPLVEQGGQFNRFMDNIAKMESGGNYQAVNKDTGAAGKYQIMPANVAAWSKEVLGKSMTVPEFLADPAAQEKIARTVLKGYVDKHGFEGAAQAWLGGEGSIGKTGRADANGTTVGAYGRMAMAGLDKPGPSAQPDPEGGSYKPGMIDQGAGKPGPSAQDEPAGNEEAGVQPREESADLLRHYRDAHGSLELTDQEKALYNHHLDNLHGEKGYHHQDGSISTTFATPVTVGDKTYMIPRVHDGRIVDPKEALELAQAKGLDNHPSYNSPEEAQDRYKLIHEFMGQDTADHLRRGQQDVGGSPASPKITMDAGEPGLINQR